MGYAPELKGGLVEQSEMVKKDQEAAAREELTRMANRLEEHLKKRFADVGESLIGLRNWLADRGIINRPGFPAQEEALFVLMRRFQGKDSPNIITVKKNLEPYVTQGENPKVNSENKALLMRCVATQFSVAVSLDILGEEIMEGKRQLPNQTTPTSLLADLVYEVAARIGQEKKISKEEKMKTLKSMIRTLSRKDQPIFLWELGEDFSTTTVQKAQRALAEIRENDLGATYQPKPLNNQDRYVLFQSVEMLELLAQCLEKICGGYLSRSTLAN